MPDSTLLVCQTAADEPESRSSVVLSRELREIDPDQSARRFRRLVNLDVPHEHDLPTYAMVATQVWADGANIHGDSPLSAHLLVPLYRRLRERVDEQTERIECIGVSGRYLDVLRDLADAKDVDLVVRDSADTDAVTERSLVAKSVVGVAVSILDALLTLLLIPFFTPSDADVLVKYPVFRPDTFREVEDRLSTPFDATFTLLTISYFFRVRGIVAPTTNVVPLRCLDSRRGVVSGYAKLATLGYDLFVSRRTETAVVGAVEAETGLRMERTVGGLYRRAAITNLRTFLYYDTTKRVFDRHDYQTLLITSSGPTAKAMALAGGDDVETYVLHHSVTTRLEFLDETFDRTVFTEGNIAESALPPDTTAVDCVPVGPPKHVDIARRASTISGTDEERRTLLLGTQPLNDETRRRLVEAVVPTVLTQTDWRVVIKTHPGEDSTFYERLFAEMDIELGDRVCVYDANLYEHIQSSDLLVTVTSNVAVESVIMGTPAVSYNSWRPLVPDPVYATEAEIPSLRNPDDLLTVLDEVESLTDRQQHLLDGPYMIDGNSIDRIADRIDREMTK